MKKDKSFYCYLLMTIYSVALIVTYFVSVRIVKFGIITSTAGAIIYPITYFLQILFYERYGKNKTILMIIHAIISLMFTGVLITIASLLPAYSAPDGLEAIFSIDFRLLFGCLTGFTVGQFLNLFLYDYLGRRKSQSFAVAASISVTLDAMLFIFLAFSGTNSFANILSLFVGQYVFCILLIACYTLFYSAFVRSIADLEMEEEKELELVSKALEEKEIPAAKKETTTKKAATKKTSSSKKTTTKKATTKKTTTKKEKAN